MSDNNIWTDTWDPAEEDWSGGGAVSKRLPRAAEQPGLGATVYELDPGDFVIYHFHHAWEELLVVLRGRPTLRTPGGEQQLDEGDSVRFLMASTISSPEVCEYPDLGQITAQARTGSLTGERLWLIHDVEGSAPQ
jgi:uncharacterized cupin superfamily protein